MATPNESLFSRIHTLSVRQLEDSLTPEEHSELQSLLLENEAARKIYVSYFQDTACLRWLCLEELSGSIEPAQSMPTNAHQNQGSRQRLDFCLQRRK